MLDNDGSDDGLDLVPRACDPLGRETKGSGMICCFPTNRGDQVLHKLISSKQTN